MNPEHYHQLDRPRTTVTVRLGGEEIARSDRTILLKEVGKQVYDPVYYFPPEDVRTDRLRRTETRTHCPIKGDASYWSYTEQNATHADLAWSYEDPLEYSEPIRGFLAFDPKRVTIEVAPCNKPATEHARERMRANANRGDSAVI